MVGWTTNPTSTGSPDFFHQQYLRINDQYFLYLRKHVYNDFGAFLTDHKKCGKKAKNRNHWKKETGVPMILNHWFGTSKVPAWSGFKNS